VIEPTWLPVREIVITNQYVVAQSGERHFLRDQGLLESAAERPKNLYYFGGETDIAILAFGLLLALARNHPFEQGNKRTGFHSAFQFLELNGYALTVPNIEEVADAVVLVVERRITEEKFVEMMRPFVVPIDE